MDDHARLARSVRFDPADDFRSRSGRDGGRRVGERYDQRVTDAHVENPIALLCAEAAATYKLVFDRRHRPSLLLEHGLATFRQRARHVFDQAAAGNVRHRFNGCHFFDRANGIVVRWVLREQRIGVRPLVKRGVPLGGGDQHARKRVAVRMKTHSRKAHDRITRLDALGVRGSR